MRSTFLPSTTLLLLLACGEDKGEDTGPAPDTDPVDEDGDGYLSDVDCDDGDAEQHPEAIEHCNGEDDDCDGETDEDAADASHWYDDEDGDGYGDPETAVWACEGEAGQVTERSDCDDSDASVNPDATEVCGDNVDEDCDGGAARCPEWGDYGTDDALALYGGLALDDEAGVHLSEAGDVNGDGNNDIVVAAPGADEGATDGGAAYVLFGPFSGEHSLSSAEASVLAAASDEKVGTDVALLGDQDGDGYNDILVGATGLEDSSGNQGGGVSIFLGPVTGVLGVADADGELLGQRDGDLSGWSVAGAGDVDGDGISDVVVGAPDSDQLGTDSGVAYLYLGPVTRSYSLYWSVARMRAEDAGYGLGMQVDSAGDIDGDGFDDLIIGSTLESFLFLGPLSGIFDTEVAGTSFMGTLVAGAGDVDADGYDDLLIGRDNGGAGEWALLFQGTAEGADPDVPMATLRAETDDVEGASAVASAGDVDGDGTADVLVGSKGFDGAWLFLGPLTGQHNLAEADARLVGDHDFGEVVAGAGDIDGDGLSEILVGAPDLDGKGGVYAFDLP